LSKGLQPIEENFKAIDLLHTVAPAGEPQTLNALSPSLIPPSLPVASQTLNASSPPFIPPSLPVASQTLNASSHLFIPPSLPATMQALPQSIQLVSQAPPTLAPIPQVQNSSDLVSVLAEAISANRLPTPEPSLFTGDPLKFKDWQLSFDALINRKNIPKNEKLYYLRKYLGAAAKKAVEGFVLLGTESAYDSAWQLLEKRFADPFVIGKSFRNKLHAWPKISSKDGCELREFADFLRSCEPPMPYIRTLEVLNDCNESQKILLKLPDWLVSRWNRKAMEVRQTRAEYPLFKEFLS